MANLLDKAKETMISRRKFLGLSASAAALHYSHFRAVG